MRDLFFLVADMCMREAIVGLLERDSIHLAIGCAEFEFDGRQDIKVASGQNDPGLYVRANELLKPYSTLHRNAAVVVDEEWEGSPGANHIRTRLQEHLDDAGWAAPRGLALVAAPECDSWLWSDSIHTPRTLGWESWDELRPALEKSNWLAEGEYKPSRPKEAAEWALRNGHIRVPRSASLYRNVASQISVNRCHDNAFLQLLEVLRVWFPMVAA